MLQVSSGDRVQMEVFARYTTATGANNNVITTLASAVTGAFGVVNAGETVAAYQALNNILPAAAAAINKNGGVAKAYLFYILFDNNYVYKQFGYQAVTSAASVTHERLYLDITIPNSGYMYIYVANESNVNTSTSVYFDDLGIVHQRTSSALQVLQTTDYYPFGLAINSSSYQKQTSLDNDYLYNGKELQDDHDLGWTDYGARMYMADIGRWNKMDSRAHNYMAQTPYGYGLENPINNVDYNGDFVLPKEFLNRFQRIAQYLANDIQGVLSNKTIVDALKKHGGFSDAQLKKIFTWGQGPVLHPSSFAGEKFDALGETMWEVFPDLSYKPGSAYIKINIDLFEALEAAEGKDRDYWLFVTAVTIIHEAVHYGYLENNVKTKTDEEGNDFEKDAYGKIIRVSTGTYKTVLDNWFQKQNRGGGTSLGSLLYNFNGTNSTSNSDSSKKGKKEVDADRKASDRSGGG